MYIALLEKLYAERPDNVPALIALAQIEAQLKAAAIIAEAFCDGYIGEDTSGESQAPVVTEEEN